MIHLGLPARWLDWIQAILSSGSSAVLLNGVPGKFFKCKHGVRQGDPLSPLLFVLVAELLQILVNKAMAIGLLQVPIPQPMSDFPIVQYADDTLLIMQATRDSFSSANHCFTASHCPQVYMLTTGSLTCIKLMCPRINSPSFPIPLAVTLESCLFMYLGLPMGTTKPCIEDFTPLMDKVERRLLACTTWLSYSERLEIVNLAITSITAYTKCTIKLPKGVIENIDRARKQCLWQGNDIEKKGAI